MKTCSIITAGVMYMLLCPFPPPYMLHFPPIFSPSSSDISAFTYSLSFPYTAPLPPLYKPFKSPWPVLQCIESLASLCDLMFQVTFANLCDALLPYMQVI
jgi:hypothetical protein